MGEHAILKLERLSLDGSAVGHLEDGRVIFVDYACPEDVAEVAVDTVKQNYLRGHVVRVLESGPGRREPACPSFGWGGCNGCQWQHISAELAHTSKRDEVVYSLAHIGKLADAQTSVRPLLASDQELGYRNKIELEARWMGGRLELGFHKSASDALVSVEACPLFAAPFKNLLKSLRGALRYALGAQSFGLNRVALRYSARTASFELACIGEPGAFPRARVTQTLAAACPQITSIVHVLRKTPAAGSARTVPVIKGVEALSGSGFWEERLGDFRYKVSAPSFFQVNTAAAERLLDCALDALQVDGSDAVADLYCGVGTFSLPLAQRAGTLTAVESSGPALRDLRRNLNKAGLSGHVQIIGGEVGRDTKELRLVDALLVDPPRAGLSASARAEITRLSPQRLAYVSCNPSTLARDLAALTTEGYRVCAVQPVDLFPQTGHVECVAELRKEPA